MKFSTKLQKYIDINKVKKGTLAVEFGISAAMMSRYLHDEAKPSYWTARRICEITNNDINMIDMGFQ